MRLCAGLRLVSLSLCAGAFGYAGTILPGLTIERAWNGSTSSSWTDVFNWNGNVLPQPGEVAFIGSGISNYPTITADTTATGLVIGGCISTPCLTNATLAVGSGSTLTLGLAATANGGSMSVSGTLHFGSQQAVFYNPVLNLAPGSALTFDDQLKLGNLGVESGGLLTMSGVVIGGNQLILDPVQEITGYGTLNLGTLTGSGVVQASNGILILNYSAIGSAGPALDVVQGATMVLNPTGTGSLQTGGMYVGGTWQGAPAGKLVLNANPDSNSPVLTTGGLDLYGKMTVQGNANPTVWIQTGGQGFTLDAPSSFADSNPQLVIGVDTNLRLDQASGDTGTRLSLGNATIQAAAGSSTSGFFNNANTRQYAGSTTTIDGVQFTNGGNLYVEGTLNLTGGSLVNNGIIAVLAGAELHVATGDSAINGVGRLTLVGGTLSADNLTNGNGHTIDGNGTIVASSLVNHGDIVADGDQPLFITAAGGVTNATDGRMAALWGTTLHIQSDLTNEGLLTTRISPPIIYFSTPNSGGTINIDDALQNIGTVDLVAADGRDATLKVTGAITNDGIFSLEASGNQASATAAGFLNNGQVLIGSGTSMWLTGGYTQSTASSETSLDGDLTVGAGQQVDIQGGTLDGNGTVHGNLNMSGILSPGHSPGELSVFGDLVMQPGGLLRMEVGPGGFDHLIVTGAFAYEGGNLEIDFLEGADPTLGAGFDLFDFGSIDGWFGTSAITIRGLAPSYRLDFDLATGTAVVDSLNSPQSTPEPTAFLLSAFGLIVMAQRHLKRSLRGRPLAASIRTWPPADSGYDAKHTS